MILIDADNARTILGVMTATKGVVNFERQKDLVAMLFDNSKAELAAMVIVLADVVRKMLTEEEMAELALEMATATGYVALETP